ncbi:unnamed protein product [Lactuca saligna]|uniref:Protein kinase domain-containing protein n=1 Tax=Lactuca saligna TaxID=75948 RepID=A0AA35YW65_LACSI|nr:unnamed protein product [Lactuca saligna]
MLQVFLPIFVLLDIALKSVSVQAQDNQSGFISIDCGIEEGSPYTDKLTTLTSFPQNARNCYTLKPTKGKGNRYLIRARFMYGNYDFKGQLPEFDIFLGPDYWDTVTFNSSSNPVNMEIIYVSSSDYIYVCLVNTGRGTGTPFVSVIELRDMYKETDFRSLYLFACLKFGSVFGTIRYKDDTHDRLWSSINWPNNTLLYTLDEVSSFLFTTIDPPSAVMTTAIMPSYPKNSININWNPDNITDQFFMYMHFAEIEILKRNLSYAKPFSPLNHTTVTIYSTEPETPAPTCPKGRQMIQMLLQCGDHIPELVYEQLNGGIDQGFAKLTMLETLDLSNNNLTGTVPDFLSGLNFLNVLNLKGNNLVGPIPEQLLSKSNKGLLSLSFDGESTGDNVSSCDANRCKNSKDNKIIVPVTATVASIFVILTAITAIWVITKRREHDKRKKGKGLEIRKQQYTYSEVQSITDNFNVVIGKGGFGTVYHRHIDDTEVAVKMLSESSLQGDKEFQAEITSKLKHLKTSAYLHLSVHHKNLISLVGYCNEGNHKGIIFEYMANGNLERHLFVRYYVQTSHGLDYLHHGCKRLIVHRDVKCSNILLNGNFQAKIADFGLSKVFPTEVGTHISTAVAGTPGYLDPEYYTSNRLTEKSDVYSFGMVLLVIITGQPAITIYDNNINISRWVNLKLAGGDMKNIVDPKLLGKSSSGDKTKAIN